jgi:GTPase SAR1 family protein
MEEDDLGPNGAVLYALEELEQNMDWLEKGLSELGEDYVLFDCPGQVELYTHHSSLRNIFFRLQKLGYRVRIFSNLEGHRLIYRTACSATSLRLVLPDAALTVHIQSDFISASNVADGPPSS